MLTAEKLHFISAKIDIFWLALTIMVFRDKRKLLRSIVIAAF